MTRWWAIPGAIAASVGAGLIHVALGPEHLEELGALGWGFYLAAALQIGWAAVALTALLARRDVAPLPRSGRIAAAGIAINVGILVSWGFARAFGLPAGEVPWVPESIGPVDSICAALQLIVVAALLLRPSGSARAARGRGAVRGLLATAMALAVITAGTGVALSTSGEHGADHEHAMTPAADIEPAGQPAAVHVHSH
jgi:hypothetical protein